VVIFLFLFLFLLVLVFSSYLSLLLVFSGLKGFA